MSKPLKPQTYYKSRNGAIWLHERDNHVVLVRKAINRGPSESDFPLGYGGVLVAVYEDGGPPHCNGYVLVKEVLE